jgi:hypothetical protein
LSRQWAPPGSPIGSPPPDATRSALVGGAVRSSVPPLPRRFASLPQQSIRSDRTPLHRPRPPRIHPGSCPANHLAASRGGLRHLRRVGVDAPTRRADDRLRYGSGFMYSDLLHLPGSGSVRAGAGVVPGPAFRPVGAPLRRGHDRDLLPSACSVTTHLLCRFGLCWTRKPEYRLRNLKIVCAPTYGVRRLVLTRTMRRTRRVDLACATSTIPRGLPG